MANQENILDQNLDIGGSVNQTDSMIKANEPLKIGKIISSGSGASISNPISNIALVSGLSGMNDSFIGNFISISGATNPSNNGSFLIIGYISPSSIQVLAPSSISESGLEWTNNSPYSLEDDLNYSRTDRSDIKGVPYYAGIPTYTRPNNTSSLIEANLLNISGKTTDAKSIIVNREYFSQSVSDGNSSIIINDTSNLKHSDGLDTTGVPVFDGYDLGNYEACFCVILGLDGYGTEIKVLSGPNKGNRIFGVTKVLSSVSPNSVGIEFRSVAPGFNLSTSIPYVWESGQPASINILIPYRKLLSDILDTDLRSFFTAGIVYGSGSGGTTTVSSVDAFQESINPTNGQTIFNLSELPSDNLTVLMFINGIKQNYGTDFTCSSQVVTYTGSYSIVTSDTIEFWYLVSGTNLTAIQESIPVLLNGQVSFNISSFPNNESNVMMFINGLKQDYGTDYTVSGLLVSFIGSYVITTSDIVEFWYLSNSPSSGGSGISETDHEKLRQLIHLADGDGPYEGFVSGAFREIIGGAFPTSVIWYESSAKLKKIVEKNIVRNQNKTPSSIEWKVYEVDGVTVLHTVTDIISYNGVYEVSRTRNVV